MPYVDMSKPNPMWDDDQLHVYLERLAIMGEGKNTNSPAACVLAYRQAEAWLPEDLNVEAK